MKVNELIETLQEFVKSGKILEGAEVMIWDEQDSVAYSAGFVEKVHVTEMYKDEAYVHPGVLNIVGRMNIDIDGGA